MQYRKMCRQQELCQLRGTVLLGTGHAEHTARSMPNMSKLIAWYLGLPEGFRVFVAFLCLIALTAAFVAGC